jgi:cysteine desulfurase / selenocysteine lyase
VPSELPAPSLGDRSLFPDLEARAYLAHAAISPVSAPVRRVVTEIAADYARRGVHAFRTCDEQRARLRAQLGRLIHANPDDIALTAGTTRGISDLALAIPWRRKDRIVCLRGEFPANVTPWQSAAELFDLEVVWLDAAGFLRCPQQSLHEFEQTLRSGVRLVAMSAVQFQTGHRMPIEILGSLCRQYGTELAVDAIQACGAIPVDVQAWQADYLTCGAHKWLMGIEGCGFLWVHPQRAGKLRPHTAGWLSHENGADFLFHGPGLLRYDRPLKRTAGVFEGSTSSAVGFAALGASVELLLQLGIPAICEHVQTYLDQLEFGLEQRGFVSLRASTAAGRSGSLSVGVREGVSAPKLSRELAARGIATSVPDGYLRFAPHWPNRTGEIPLVLEAVDASLVDASS